MTAVEWYSDKLLQIIGELVNNFSTEQTMANHYALKQAKEIEKQKLIEMHDKGFDSVKQLNDEYAIEFVEWKDDFLLNRKIIFENYTKSTKELLEIFKKEKGL
jgi:hypothetical protein